MRPFVTATPLRVAGILFERCGFDLRAARSCAAVAGGIGRLAPGLTLAVALACGGAARAPGSVAALDLVVVTAQAPSDAERYCAWYGTQRGGILYFGQSAFWSALRTHGGDPTADLLAPGPQRIGRFDLASETLLAPLEVGEPGDRSGVWDVAMGADGWLYFTRFFESAGRVDPVSGRVESLASLGPALNELAPGPDGTLLASRYGSGGSGAEDGSVIAFDGRGRIVAEWPLAMPGDLRVAPKSVAWDTARRELWVTADLLPRESGAAVRHAAFVLDRDGALLQRIEIPEIQFVTQRSDGALLRAEVDASALTLRITPPPGVSDGIRAILLDADFPAAFDFVQDMQEAADGRVVVTRWSGRVHIVERNGRISTARLPRIDPQGIYYTAVLRGDRLCASYCADVTVVCIDAPR